MSTAALDAEHQFLATRLQTYFGNEVHSFVLSAQGGRRGSGLAAFRLTVFDAQGRALVPAHHAPDEQLVSLTEQAQHLHGLGHWLIDFHPTPRRKKTSAPAVADRNSSPA